jgi:16S rRNA (adenine1518-N6/adenine1519-N6)-dimethyltransferase
MMHHAKKSLGQNFLKSQPALRMMCEAGDVDASDIVVEIGPGKGALTEKLLAAAKKVIAVEKDRELVLILKQKFAAELRSEKLILIEDDILNFDPKKYDLDAHAYKIIANIPYNITGAIIKYFLSETVQPALMVLLVQKEVAQRIVAADKKESILSLSVKAYGTPKYVMKVGKKYFSPSPKVDSAILSIKGIGRNNFRSMSEEKFFAVVKTGFSHKRKVLRKNLEAIAPKEMIDSMFEKLDIDQKTRAEDVALPIWLAIARYLEEIK